MGSEATTPCSMSVISCEWRVVTSDRSGHRMRWSPLWGSTILAACAAVGPGSHPGTVNTANKGVIFSLVAPTARSVAVAGSFNGWSAQSHSMQAKNGDGNWSLEMSLPPGEYQFMYVVDGQRWVTPPVADDFVKDGFGQKNGVVVVR